MSFSVWDSVRTDTPLRDLCGSSLLIHGNEPRNAVLVRFSPGLEEDRIQVVHARVTRANALKMEDADADIPIGEQAARLLPGASLRIVSVPHITWKHPAGGRRWRTPVALGSAVVTAAALLALHPTTWPFVALTAAIAIGGLVWFLSRPWVPTHVGPLGGEHSRGVDAVDYAMRHVGSPRIAETPASPRSQSVPTPEVAGPDIQWSHERDEGTPAGRRVLQQGQGVHPRQQLHRRPDRR